ncbi:hypothetical protein [Clostridium thermarum]|uniref:hypothetical protein n=1 Tax=Clostridium thermarum TaxID=1716543 RepID=UPI001120A968|nr:hypothetical protein [Clostridium thermarum]
MKFFKKSILKLRSEIKEGKYNYYIDYSRLKEAEILKKRLLMEFIGDNLCLIVMNTKMFYKKADVDYQSIGDELIALLEESDISYKKITYKKSDEATILGLKMKVKVSEKQRDYALGFVVVWDNLEKLMSLISQDNMYYCIDKSGESAAELINRFQNKHDDTEELKQSFAFSIFDNNFAGQLAIVSENEVSDTIKKILSEFDASIR